MTARRWFVHADASLVRSGAYFRGQRNLDGTGSVQQPGSGRTIGLDRRLQNSKCGTLHAADRWRSLAPPRGAAVHFNKSAPIALENIERTSIEASRAGASKQIRKRAPPLARRRPFQTRRDSSGVHRLEEFRVVLGVAQLVEQEVDRIHRAHRIEDPAQHVHLLEELLIGDQLFLAGAGA